MELFSEAAFDRLMWCVRVCSIQCMCLSKKLLHACQTALVLFFCISMCSCVSRPHQLIFALCNVNCVRTNVSFWVLYYNNLFFFYFFYSFNLKV